MWKKKPVLAPKHVISGKERKQLISALSKSFDQPALETLLNSNENLSRAKISKTTTNVLFSEKDPLIFEQTGDDQPFPSVFALALSSRLVPLCIVVKPGVEKFLKNGANLMWPGVGIVFRPGKEEEINLETEVSWKMEELVSIWTTDERPVAVGMMRESSSMTTRNGIAVVLFHYEGDGLYQLGSRGLDELASTLDEPKLEEEENKIEIKKDVSEEEMSKWIREAFLNCLRLSFKSENLPVDVGQFQKEYMMPSRPLNSFLDVKRSTFKSLGNFLSEMEKEGIILLDKPNKTKIIKVDFQHDSVKAHQTSIDHPAETPKENKGQAFEILRKVSMTISPSKEVSDLLKIPQASMNYLDFQVILDRWMLNNKLVKKDKIVLNKKYQEILESVLNNFNFEVPEDGAPGIEVKVNRQAFVDAVEKQCQFSHEVFVAKTGKKSENKGRFRALRIHATKAGPKFVTIINGIGYFTPDMDKVLKYLRVKFDTSGTIDTDQQKEEVISLQGTFLDELRKELSNIFGVEEGLIEMKNSSKRKA